MHSVRRARFKGTLSNSCKTVPRDPDNDGGNLSTDSEIAPRSPSKDVPQNEVYAHVAEDHTYVLCGNDSEVGEHRDSTLGEDEFADVKMENPNQANPEESEVTDDSSSTQGYDTEVSLSGECVEKRHDDDDAHSEASDVCPGDQSSDSDSKSNSSESSSGSSYSPGIFAHSNKKPDTCSSSVCTACGRGPFRNIKVHLLHCPAGEKMFPCSKCKAVFPSQRLLLQHQMSLYSCELCGQVFPKWKICKYHSCPKGTRSNSQTVLLFCTESMPKSCNICKAFFSNQCSLLNHVIIAHSSRVSTKVCIPTHPSRLTDNSTSPVAHLVPTSSSGHALVSSSTATCQSPRALNRIISGKPSVEQSYSGSLSAVVQFSPSSSPSSSYLDMVPMTPGLIKGGATSFMIHHQQTPSTVRQRSTTNPQVTVMTQKMTTSLRTLMNMQPPTRASPAQAPILMDVHSTAVGSGAGSALGQGTNQHPGHASVPVPATAPATVASHAVCPDIVALFKNDSRQMALKKRRNTGWRSKAAYRCRQCGAISRQPSLIISHRYLHRGLRSHRCQCGRAFKHRLHLLRHCMQHAEATSYICVSCGDTFTGAKLLAEHLKGKSRKSIPSGGTWKHSAMRKCRMPFTCDCGQLFFRPSAYIWHQLKNRTKVTRKKTPSKW